MDKNKHTWEENAQSALQFQEVLLIKYKLNSVGTVVGRNQRHFKHNEARPCLKNL